MKNIRIYHAPKYNTSEYEEIETNIYKTLEKDQGEIIYVTSLMFEQEPEYGENEPDGAEVSQYPLEDILDKFLCACEDFYEEENEKDPVNSYMEFVSPNIQDIKDLLSIVGKHVYNKEDGEYIELIIE